MRLRCLLITLAAVLSQACSTTEQAKSGTLGELVAAKPDHFERPQIQVDEQQLIQRYRALLEVEPDPETRIHAQYRLADLAILQGEQQLADGQPVDLSGLIADYTTLLGQYPDRAENEAVLYQLAKAHALNGELDAAYRRLTELVNRFPDSQHAAEAQFRRGDYLFNRSEYAAAAEAFAAVSRDHADSAYAHNATYLLGWSEFKRSRFAASQQAFVQTLDGAEGLEQGLTQLSRGDKALVEDTLRVLSLMFSFDAGSASLDAMLTRLGSRPYEALLYQHLAELLVEKELYEQAAESYRAYIRKYPQQLQSARFDMALLDLYQQAGFSQRMAAEKERFVAQWGARSAFWQQASAEQRAVLADRLEQHLSERAQHYHALAQLKQKRQPQQVPAEFLLAADWYAQFIETFPSHSEVASRRFLMAEALFDAGRFAQSSAQFVMVAYPDAGAAPANAAEAGYAALLAKQQQLQHIPPADETTRVVVTEQAIELALRFVSHFSDDKRALATLAKAAQQQFALQQFSQAQTSATRLLQWPEPVPADLQQIALQIEGHASFELKQFERAEQAYLALLPQLAPAQTEYKAVRKKLAVAIYRQGEAARAAGDNSKAIDDFLRLGQTVPESSFRRSAEFDAADLLLAAGRMPEAVKVLDQFRQRYPQDPLLVTIPAKLALAYESLGLFAQAADELLLIAKQDKDAEARRQAQLLAAELYQKADQPAQAIAAYRTYAHSYPQPYPQVMEVRFNLAELYQRQQDPLKRNFWLQKLIKGHAQAGADNNQRTSYLAAFAARDLALQSQQQFERIKLKLPLRSSLKKKRAALEQALQAWQLVASYKVAEFSTEATFQIGQIYAGLSRALLDSDRPQGLDELSLEQYELLLEEQAYPFEEQAIAIHQANAENAWQGVYDSWVRQSFARLAELLPAQYNKPEEGLNATGLLH